jgi:hypothetical protein
MVSVNHLQLMIRHSLPFRRKHPQSCIKEEMGFRANVLKVMIASPGDVATERDIITGELYRWNDTNAVARELMQQSPRPEHRHFSQTARPHTHA